MKRNSGNEVHDNLVRDLEKILFNTMDYEKVHLFWEYCRNGQVGEVDLLAMADSIYDFYEVKRTRNSKSVKKAAEQYHRFQEAFPKWTTNGFLYTGDKGLERIQ